MHRKRWFYFRRFSQLAISLNSFHCKIPFIKSQLFRNDFSIYQGTLFFRSVISNTYRSSIFLYVRQSRRRDALVCRTATRVLMPMDPILFTIDYCKLRLGVLFGLRSTRGPLDVGWRWKIWKRKKEWERQITYPGVFSGLRSDLNRLWRSIVN